MTRLERLAHLAFVGLCLVGIVLMLEARFRGRTRMPEVVPVQDAVGKHLDLPNVSWGSMPVSLVLQLSPTCTFCNQSMPFYRKLAGVRLDGKSLPIVVATIGSGEAMKAKLSENHIDAPRVIVIETPLFGLAETPVLFLVDSQGIVGHTYLGKLDNRAEDEILQYVREGKRRG